MEKNKRKTISFKLSKDTFEKLKNLCILYNVDQSKVIRALINIEFEKITMMNNLSKKDKKNS